MAELNPEFNRMFNDRLMYTAVKKADINVFDFENMNILPNEAKVKAFCEAYKPYYLTDVKSVPEVFFGYEGLPFGIHFFQNYDASVNIFFDYSRLKDLEYNPSFSAIRTMDGGLNATVYEGLAVRSGTKNAENAWNFIKIMLSEEMQYSQPGGYGGLNAFPVNVAALGRQIDEILQTDTKVGFGTSDGKYESFNCPAVPPEEKEPYMALHDSVISCALFNHNTNAVFFYCMEPFFADQKSYDECIDDFRSGMEKYIANGNAFTD